MSAKKDRAKKRETAEKVKEIQMRQKNWFQQREQHLKSKEKPSSAIDYTGSRKKCENKPDTNFQPQKEESVKLTSQSTRPSQKFRTWLQARDEKVEEKHLNHSSEDDSVNVLKVSSSRTPGYASPQSDEEGYTFHSVYRDRNDAVDKLMSPQDFDALADSIVSRVKQDLCLQNPSSDHSTGGSLKPQRREELTRINTKTEIKKDKNIDTSGHVCPLCHRLMMPPYNEPMINIPCGHSVCQQCCVEHICPLCQCHVTSRMCNMMLLQVIQDYHNKDLPTRERTSVSNSSYTPERYREKSSLYKKRQNYREERENLIARQDVLRTELRGIKQNMSDIERRKVKLSKQVQNITSEENNIRGQISSLEEKLKTLVSHKEEYKREQTELQRKSTTETNQLNLIQDTLMDIEIQIEKINLLAENR